MRIRSMVAIGFVSAMAGIGLVNTADSVASEMNRSDLIEERVGHGGSMYYRAGQVSGCNEAAGEQNRRELVEERVGHGGSIYHKRSDTGRTGHCDVNRGETAHFYSPPIAR
jgi:hypothetical protein